MFETPSCALKDLLLGLVLLALAIEKLQRMRRQFYSPFLVHIAEIMFYMQGGALGIARHDIIEFDPARFRFLDAGFEQQIEEKDRAGIGSCAACHASCRCKTVADLLVSQHGRQRRRALALSERDCRIHIQRAFGSQPSEKNFECGDAPRISLAAAGFATHTLHPTKKRTKYMRT